MKVLVVATPSGRGGGVSAVADEMVETLGRLGHDVERVAIDSRRRRRPNRANVGNAVAAAVDAVAVARAARRRRPDVVWFHTLGVPTLPAARTLSTLIALRLVRRHVVVHLHAYDIEGQLARGGRILRALVRRVASLSEVVVVLHESAESALRSMASAGRVQVVRNWVDVPQHASPLPSMPPLRLLFVGGLIERKGVPELLEAIRIVDSADLSLDLIGGPGEDGLERSTALTAGAADLVAAGRVRFLGQLPATEVRAALAACHVFVLPSKAEGTPMALLEALAEGRPVIVGDAGDMAAIVGEAACGFVLSETDATSIAGAILLMVEQSAGLAHMGERAHAVASQGFSASAVEAQLSSVLAASFPGSAVVRSRRSSA